MGVGMPNTIWLNDFGSKVWDAFGGPPYLVGSALTEKVWRDVDIRMILKDEDYAAMGLGDPARSHDNEKWLALCLAFSGMSLLMYSNRLLRKRAHKSSCL